MKYVYDEMGGFGGFGDVGTDWKNWIRASFRGTTPGLSTATMIYDHAVSRPADVDAWIARLPSMSCAEMARSIGQSFDTTAICAAFDEIVPGGWNTAREDIRLELAAAESRKWETATCSDRAVTDGGGSVCTADDGAQQVRCYNPRTGVVDTYPAGTRCPGGTGGMPVTFVSRPKEMTTTVSSGTGKPVLQGRVVDPDGVPVAGATVRLTAVGGSMGAALKSTTTDASGMFSMQPSAGTYDLVVGMAGFNNVRFSPITVPSSGTTTTADLVLETTATIGGGDDLPPSSCPEGQVLDTLTGECVDIGSACPEGQMLDSATGTCVPVSTDEEGTGAKPWYKSPWTWVIGGAVVVGGVYFLTRDGKKGE